MSARIKHVAIVSNEVSRLGEFYAAVLDMEYRGRAPRRGKRDVTEP
jgi:hypothetical protein